MVERNRSSRLQASVVSLVRPTTATLLIALQALPCLAFAARPKRAATNLQGQGLTEEQRALHLLNRFSFGPLPGQVAAVEHQGVEAWFEQQLHPEQIADSGLAARLAQYPAMELPQQELVQRFPTPGMLRAYNNGKLALPQDSTDRAVYADAALQYEEKHEVRAASRQLSSAGGEAGPADNSPPALAGQGTAASSASAIAPIVRQLKVEGSDTAATRQALLRLAPTERYQKLILMSPDQMAALQATLKGPETEQIMEGLTPAQAEVVNAMKAPEHLIDTELLATRLLRDVYSTRQLQVVMADFWLNHFNIYLRKNQNEPYLLPAYEREVILPNVLGRFEDLLIATARSPAMLVYLDNWESVGPGSRNAQRRQGTKGTDEAAKASRKSLNGINENYARELMELHTLGVDGGYSQQDIIEVAKCFTGWTIDRPEQGGEFVFNPNRHEPGSKVVLGHMIPEGGVEEGLAVLHLLATNPATAHFVSFKLAQRFVSDNPPPAIVDRLSAAYLRSDGDIACVLTALFHSPEFWSPAVYRVKVKTPLEFLASALRASGADVSRPQPAVQALDRLGMPLFGMQTPNGYPATAEGWVSSNALLTRMNFALMLSADRLRGTQVDWTSLLGNNVAAQKTPDTGTEERLEMLLLGQPASPQTRAAALAEAETPGVGAQAEQSFREVRTKNAVPAPGGQLPLDKADSPFGKPSSADALATVAGLLLGSPDFQRR